MALSTRWPSGTTCIMIQPGQDTLLDTQGEPIGLTIPKSGDDLWALAESIRTFAIRNAGQITQTPVLAHLLLLAVRDSVHAGGNKDCITAIDAYRDRMAHEGLLATGPFPGHKPTASGHRLSGSPQR